MAQLGPPGGRQPRDQGVRAAARDLNLERKAVTRAVKIAGITTEAKEAARAAGLDDNQKVLLKVAAAPQERQVEALEAICLATSRAPGLQITGFVTTFPTGKMWVRSGAQAVT